MCSQCTSNFIFNLTDADTCETWPWSVSSLKTGSLQYSQSGRGGHPPCLQRQEYQEYTVCCWPADLMGNVLQSLGGKEKFGTGDGRRGRLSVSRGQCWTGATNTQTIFFFSPLQLYQWSCTIYPATRLPYLSKINLLLCSVCTLFSIDQPLWRLPAETHTQIVNAKSYWHVGRARQEGGGNHHVENKNGPKLLRGGWVGVECHALTAVHAWLDWSPRTLLNMQLWPLNYSLVWLPTEARQSADVDVATGRSTFINWLVSTLAWPLAGHVIGICMTKAAGRQASLCCGGEAGLCHARLRSYESSITNIRNQRYRWPKL